MDQLMEAWKTAQAQAYSASWLWQNKDVGRLCKSGERSGKLYKALEMRKSRGLNGNSEMGWTGAGVLVAVYSLTKLRRSSSEKMNSGSLREPETGSVRCTAHGISSASRHKLAWWNSLCCKPKCSGHQRNMICFWPPIRRAKLCQGLEVCLVAKCSHCLKILSLMEEKIALVPAGRCVKVCNGAAAQGRYNLNGYVSVLTFLHTLRIGGQDNVTSGK